ncbi:MAG TPA: hypothetical protein VGH33_22005 [Isosphaeraceae bacterium]
MAPHPYPAKLDDDIVLTDDPGPFRPPAGYRFEDELQGPAPRPRAETLKQGRYAAKQRQTTWALIVVGAILAVLGPLPIVQTMGLYFLPLAYLTWIGLGILALGAAGLVSNALRSGPYRYVEEGVPIVARILALRLVPAVIYEGNATQYKFEATFEHLDAEAGEPRTAVAASSPFLADLRDGLTTSYRVGDYATAVYLPHDPAKTLRLYGFLDLRPDLGLVRRDGAPPSSPIKTVLAILTIVSIFAVLIWNLYAIGRFSPVRISPTSAVIVGGVGAIGLGGFVLWWLAAQQSKARRKREERNVEALARGEAVEPDTGQKRGPFSNHGLIMTLILAAGSLLLGGLTVFCWAITANAWLDGSPATAKPILIDEMVQVTHKAIFREYKIKYHFLDDPKTKHEYLSSPAHLATLDGPLALAEVHAGCFGWPWVKEIRSAPHRGVRGVKLGP